MKSTKESISAIIFGPISRVPKRRGVKGDRQAIGSPVWSAYLEWKNKEEKQDGDLHHRRRRKETRWRLSP